MRLEREEQTTTGEESQSLHESESRVECRVRDRERRAERASVGGEESGREEPRLKIAGFAASEWSGRSIERQSESSPNRA